MEKDLFPIDIVITWVDGSDPQWILERNKHVSQNDINNKSTGGKERYDDNGLLKFLFRSIECFAPWVNKIFFVTCGQLPKWLNTNNSKLIIINHHDFIDANFLPTFSGNPLALNLHRIPGLSEHFIYLNDDMYFISNVSRSDFFRKGLPCDMAVQDILECFDYKDNYQYTLVNDLSIINKNFDKKYVLKKNKRKWFTLKYGLKNYFKNRILSLFACFTGFYEPHTPASYLKSSFDFMWNVANTEYTETCLSKVRSFTNCTENTIRFYQIISGNFYPFNRSKIGAYFNMSSKKLPFIIKQQRLKMICINYSNDESRNDITNAFASILPNKSSFEI